MTRDEAIKAYSDKFGGFPYFLMMGADDDYVVERVEEALRTGKEIEPEVDGVAY